MDSTQRPELEPAGDAASAQGGAYRARGWLHLLAVLAVLAALLLTRWHNYLLFHCLVEIFSITVAFGIFIVFWNARHFLDNGCFLFIGIAFLFVGLLDVLHALAYQGMGVFAEAGPNLATQLWISARSVQSISLLAAPIFLSRRFEPYRVLLGYTLGTALLLAAIFYWHVFPVCYEPGHGLTTFKIGSEYAICVSLLLALYLLYRRREELDAGVFRLLMLSIVLTVASELTFTLYVDVTGPINVLGHLLKLASFYAIYVAFVEVALTNPYSVLFRNLTNTERQLKTANETLEQRVAQRTLEAEQRSEQLRVLASELTLAEQRERRRLARTLHDHLQQLLVAAKLKVGMLQRRVKDERKTSTLAQVVELLDESINVSRSLTVELSPAVLHDAGLVAALQWLARQMQEKHELSVEVQADTEAEPEAEEVRILVFHAVRELLFNVVKHAGTNVARVRLTRTEDLQMRVLVADAGNGFDPAKLLPGMNDGTGYGLFGIRERLGAMGGRLEVDTAEHQGTRIAIFAPLEQHNAASTSPESSRPLASTPRQAAPSKPPPVPTDDDADTIRVLLADDHELVREGLVSLLQEQAGIEVVGDAPDGQTAVELARQTLPDVVVMDVTMPGLNGAEATRRITAELPRVAVIALSMHDERDMGPAMREAGAAAYVQKDGHADELIDAIRRVGSAMAETRLVN